MGRIKPEAAAARDRAIIAAWEQSDRTKPYRAIAEEVGCCVDVVGQVIRAHAGPQRAPGAGRSKERPRRPILDIVIDLCTAALDLKRGKPRPKKLTSAIAELRERESWPELLRAELRAEEPPEQLELELDPLQVVEEQIAQIREAIQRAEKDTEKRQHRQVLRDYLQLRERLEPPEERGKVTMSEADAVAHAAAGRSKLAGVVARLQDQRRETLEQMRADGEMTPEVIRAFRRVGVLRQEEKE